MITLFSSKAIKEIAEEIKQRQNMEMQWTNEDGKLREIPNKLSVDDVELCIDMFVEELCRRFPVSGRNDEELGYFSDDTPRLTKK